MLIAQISDPHISLERPPKQEALRRTVSHLLGLPLRPDAVVVTGDCADGGTPAEYARLRELLEPLPMPVYVVPGNHDQRHTLQAAFGEQGTHGLPGFVQYAAQVGPLRLLALDTHVPGQNGGLLDTPRLNWLAERLDEAPETPTLIFMHHPPLVSGLSVMDSIGLEGTERLRDVLARHPQVRRVLAGHTHMAQTQTFGGTLLMVCPGTDFGFLPDLTQPERLVVQMQPALCLLHHLAPQGEVLTYSSVIGDYAPVTLHNGKAWL